MDQKDMWKAHTSNMSVETILKAYESPALFQEELSQLINSENKGGKIAEIGCEEGITSILLDDSFQKTLVDLNDGVLQLSQKAFALLGKKAEFCNEDMFSMNFADGTFDIIFNAGVLEHFTFQERVNAIKEYARVLKKGGVMYLAVPNEYSVPYRLGKILREKFGHWPYPKAYRIYDFSKEIEDIDELEVVYRTVISKNTCRWLDFSKLLQTIFECIDKIVDFEGYLIVVKIRKC